MLTTIITTLVSLLVGGAITWAVSRSYYQKASADLVREAARLREQTNLMLWALWEYSGTGSVKYNTDPETGEPKGLSVKRTATGHVGRLGGEAHVETRKADPGNTPEAGND